MEALNVQVRQIDGDLAVLLFNPSEADLRVGETLTLHERGTGRSVIVQVAPGTRLAPQVLPWT